MEACSRCKARIRWGVNLKTGKKQPFNYEPDERGNRVMDEFDNVHTHTPGEPVPEGMHGPYYPHHGTCPFAKEFRK
jgi:hypothetical protein